MNTLREMIAPSQEHNNNKEDGYLWRIIGAAAAASTIALATTSIAYLPPRSEYSRNLENPCLDPRGETVTLETSVTAHGGSEGRPPGFSDLKGEWVDTVTLPAGTEVTIKGIDRGAEVQRRGGGEGMEEIRSTSRVWYSIEAIGGEEALGDGQEMHIPGVHTNIDNDMVCFDKEAYARK